MATPPAPAPIQAVGAPPEIHADRVTAEMMRYLVAQSAHIRETVRKIIMTTAHDVGPKGQEQIIKRIEAAGTTTLDERFLGSNHIRLHRRACRTMCERRGSD
jgi:hypothetical protein